MTGRTGADRTRYPFAPVDEVFYSDDRLRYGPNDINRSDKDLAEALDVEPRTIVRWRVTGLAWFRADRIAVKLGCHPSRLWPEWYPNTPVGRMPERDQIVAAP